MRLLDLFVFKYNRTDFHELNLDWLISDVRTLAETLQNFISLNTIKYADPIQWNITTQYEANTVVIDGNTGTAYLSTKPVPSGVALTNTDYWTIIFTLDILSANQNITFRNDGSNVLATFGSAAGDWLLWNATLYKVSQTINVNEAYVDGYNLTRYTVELFIQDLKTYIINIIGDLDDLSTTDKSNIVAAINELVQSISDTNTKIGDLDDLDTTDKSNIVAAINEVENVASLAATSQQFIYPEDYGAIGDATTDDSTALQSCFNYAVANNKIVCLRNKYKLSSSVDMPSNLKVLGVGVNEVIDDCTITSPDVTGIFNAYQVDNIQIEGVNFKGKNTDGNNVATYEAGALITLNKSTNCIITKCSFVGSTRVACVYSFDHCEHVTIDHCSTLYSTYGDFINSNAGNYFTVQYCDIKNHRYVPSQAFNQYAIMLNGDTRSEITDVGSHLKALFNTISHDLPDWEMIDAHGGTDILVIGNYLDGCTNGIACFSETGDREFHINSMIIANNIIRCRTGVNPYNQVATGITASGRDVIIANNTIYRGGGYRPANNTTVNFGGIRIVYEGYVVKITNNLIFDAYMYGIAIQGVNPLLISDVDISENLVTTQPVSGVDYSTYFDDGGLIGYVNIHNNSFYSTSASKHRIPSAKTVSYQNIRYDDNSYLIPFTFENIANCKPDRCLRSEIASVQIGNVGDKIICNDGGSGLPVMWICTAGGATTQTRVYTAINGA